MCVSGQTRNSQARRPLAPPIIFFFMFVTHGSHIIQPRSGSIESHCKQLCEMVRQHPTQSIAGHTACLAQDQSFINGDYGRRYWHPKNGLRFCIPFAPFFPCRNYTVTSWHITTIHPRVLIVLLDNIYLTKSNRKRIEISHISHTHHSQHILTHTLEHDYLIT